MSEPIRRIQFAASPQGVVPATPQAAGVQGDHNATEVVFTLSADLIREEYRYRFEYVDGGGGGDSTDFIPLSGQTVSVLLPAAWTAVGGCGTLSLCVVVLDEENNEEQIAYSLAARLQYAPRERTAAEAAYEKGLSALIADTHDAAGEARSAAEDAIEAAGRADESATAAYAAAEEILAQRDAGLFKGEKGDPGESGTVTDETATTLTGLLKGNGQTVTTAEPDADYIAPTGGRMTGELILDGAPILMGNDPAKSASYGTVVWDEVQKELHLKAPGTPPGDPWPSPDANEIMIGARQSIFNKEVVVPHIWLRRDNPSIGVQTPDGTILAAYNTNPYDNVISFYAYHKDDGGTAERFMLPAPSNGVKEHKEYKILTSKAPVGIEEGGTSATTAEEARKKLGITEINDAVNRSGDTMTGPLETKGLSTKDVELPSTNFKNDNGDVIGAVGTAVYSNRTFLRQSTLDSEGKQTGLFEHYMLPTPDKDLSESRYYSFLTSKVPVPIAQGGTGATTAEGAWENLGWKTVEYNLTVDSEFFASSASTLTLYRFGRVITITGFLKRNGVEITDSSMVNIVTALPSGCAPNKALEVPCVDQNGKPWCLHIYSTGNGSLSYGMYEVNGWSAPLDTLHIHATYIAL